MLWCGRCKTQKPMSDFWKSSKRRRGYQGYCKPCARLYTDPYYKADRHLKAKYGISKKDYDQLFVLQDGCCAICSTRSDKTLFVDHNHETGTVRGLLCRDCNLFIGFGREDAERLRAGAAYLERHRVS